MFLLDFAGFFNGIRFAKKNRLSKNNISKYIFKCYEKRTLLFIFHRCCSSFIRFRIFYLLNVYQEREAKSKSKAIDYVHREK